MRQSEPSGLEIPDKNLRDQVARDHEEDIDADESACQDGRERVKDDDREYRHRSEAVDVGTVLDRRHHQVGKTSILGFESLLTPASRIAEPERGPERWCRVSIATR